MTVRELIDRLEEVAEQHGEDRPVRLVYQQNYPLQDTVKGVWAPEPDEETGEIDPASDGAVYVVSAGQIYDKPYGPAQAFEEAY